MLEKQSRLSEDITSTKMCCKAILEVLYSAGDWQQLNEHILLLAKRRSQLKQVDDLSDESRLSLLGCLCHEPSFKLTQAIWCRPFKHLSARQWIMSRRRQTRKPRLS